MALNVLAGRSDRTFLLVACALTVALRAPLLAMEVVPTSDFAWYFGAAQSIAAGQGYAEGGVPTAFWPVGWPGFLAFWLWLFGPQVWPGQVANLAMAVGVTVAIRYVGACLFPGRAVWRLAALAIALLPNQIAYVPLLSTEIYFEFLLMVGFALMITRPAWLAGLLFGAAALTKAQGMLMPGALALPLLFTDLRRWAIAVAVTGIAVAAVVVPWTARNYAVLGAIVPVSTNGGFTLLTGNNPSARGGYTPDDPLVTGLSQDPRDQVAMDRLARQRAMDWIRADPGGFVRLLPLKFIGLWWRDGEAEWLYQRGFASYERYVLLFRAVRVANQVAYLAVMALAVAGIPAMWRQRQSLPAWCWSGWALAGYFTVVSLVFSGQPRFHFALMPFFALYAGWTVTRIACRTGPPTSPTPPGSPAATAPRCS